MRQNLKLTIVSLLNALLLSVHFIQDVMHGVEPPKSILNMAVILLVWVCVTVLLAGRTAGYVLLLIGSLLAAAMPVIHTMNVTTLKWEFSFYWTLLALGVLGLFGAVLAALGLWRQLRSRANA
jgi:hypothetical protein